MSLIVIEMLTNLYVEEEDKTVLYGRPLPSTVLEMIVNEGQSVIDQVEVESTSRPEFEYASGPKDLATKPAGAGVFPSPTFIPFLFEYVAREYTSYGVKQYD